jgi:hypothetical protein
MSSLGSISPLGKRYLNGDMKQKPLRGNISLSSKDDVRRLEAFSDSDRTRHRDLGIEALRAGRVAFTVLAAGASSRMSLNDLPTEVVEMLKRSGKHDLPLSKALVPVIERAGKVYNFLDLFLLNCRRYLEQYAARAKTVIFVSEMNADEIRRHMEFCDRQGLPEADVLDFVQPIEPQMVATVADLKKAESNFKAETFASAESFSVEYAGNELPQRKPAGHGEFLHQMVASGTLARLLDDGVEFISVRNIDNTAAVLDDNWSEALGWMISQESDILLEVSQRPEGQQGGALIRANGDWRIAEDPSFDGTEWKAKDSFYMNNAVAIIALKYLLKIYNTTAEEVLSGDTELWSEIADRGQRKFPMLIEAKPVVLDDGQVVGAVIPETNMWESTGVGNNLIVTALAVDSDRNAGDLFSLDATEQQRIAERVRFSPTKNWSDYSDERKQLIARYIASRIVDGTLA